MRSIVLCLSIFNLLNVQCSVVYPRWSSDIPYTTWRYTCHNVLEFTKIGKGSVTCASDTPVFIDVQVTQNTEITTTAFSISTKRTPCDWSSSSSKTDQLFWSVIKIKETLLNVSEPESVIMEFECKNYYRLEKIALRIVRVPTNEYKLYKPGDSKSIHNTGLNTLFSQSTCFQIKFAWSPSLKTFTCRKNNTANQTTAQFFKCKDLQNCHLELNFISNNAPCLGNYELPDCKKNRSNCLWKYYEPVDNGILHCTGSQQFAYIPIFAFRMRPSDLFEDNDLVLKNFVRLEFKPKNSTNVTMFNNCFAPTFLAIPGFIWETHFENVSANMECYIKRVADKIHVNETCTLRRPPGCSDPCNFQINCSVYFQNGREYKSFVNCSFATQNCSVPETFYVSPKRVSSTRTTLAKSDLHRSSTTLTVTLGESTTNLNKVEELPWKLVLFVGVIAMSMLILLLLFIRYYRKSKQRKSRLVSSEEIRNFLEGAIQISNLNHAKERGAIVVPYDMKLEIPRRNIKLESNILGKGNFGKVVQGYVGNTSVAVKMLDKNVEPQYFRAILSELKIMSFVGKHEHIVALVGANTEKIKNRDVYIILELCPNGNARDYIRNRRGDFLDLITEVVNAPEYTNMILGDKFISKKLCSIDLIRWSTEIAAGMDFIASKNVCHGDLAARNILLTENLVAKIGDFGLATQLRDYSLYVL